MAAAEIPGARFLIIGEGSLRQELTERSKRLGIEGKVIFTGWRDDIPDILPVLDILVLTSLNEAVGRVLLEAGSAGKPVVATDVGGVSEILKNGETGILVPPKNPQKIAEAVIDLLKDEAKRHRMGNAAKDWVKGNFDEKMMLKKIDNMYTETLAI